MRIALLVLYLVVSGIIAGILAPGLVYEEDCPWAFLPRWPSVAVVGTLWIGGIGLALWAQRPSRHPRLGFAIPLVSMIIPLLVAVPSFHQAKTHLALRYAIGELQRRAIQRSMAPLGSVPIHFGPHYVIDAYGKTAVPYLLELLDHENRYVRGEALMYLEWISRIEFDWDDAETPEMERIVIDRVRAWWNHYKDRPLLDPQDLIGFHWTSLPELVYEALPARKAHILENYSKLHVGMSQFDVEKILGPADREQGRPWCKIYWLSVNKGPTQSLTVYTRPDKPFVVTGIEPKNLFD